MDILRIDGDSLTFVDVERVALANTGEPYEKDSLVNIRVEIDSSAWDKIDRSREYVERILGDGQAHYGINTGFGDFERIRIKEEDLKQLQINLIRSHSAGVGEKLSTPIVRAMMLLRANALCRGNSGVRRVVIERILDMLNRGIHPVVPSRGSVGASGDLAPLSHIALSLIGEGEVEYKGKIMESLTAFKEEGIEPLELKEKEGLALINGTQLMTACGSLVLAEMERLLDMADLCGAMSVEALLGTDRAFLPLIQNARPHGGQKKSAKNLMRYLKGSQIILSHRDCGRVQDAYSLRCIPAVNGACREAFEFARRVISIEMNSSVDNPLVFAHEDQVLSGGNFHGAPVALVLESLAVGLSMICNMSERRIDRMVNRHYSNGLPPFLAREGGLNSGLMIAHYSASALCSENKVLCHPACCDSIPTSGGQEDHVSMGSISGLKLLKILEHAWTILGIEILTACEALEHHKPARPGEGTAGAYEIIRRQISPLEKDRPLYKDIEKTVLLIRKEGFIKEVEEKIRNLNM